MNRKMIVAAAAFCFVGIAVASSYDKKVAEATQARYCNEVAIWNAEAARGIRPERRTGQPDWRGIADEHCPAQ